MATAKSRETVWEQWRQLVNISALEDGTTG